MSDSSDLTAFAWKLRSSPAKPGPTDVLEFSDMEISYYIGRRGGNWVLEETSRSSQRLLLGSFETQLDAERFLAQRFGRSWRSFRSPEISHESVAEGFILEDSPTAWVLTGGGRTAEFPGEPGDPVGSVGRDRVQSHCRHVSGRVPSDSDGSTDADPSSFRRMAAILSP